MSQEKVTPEYPETDVSIGLSEEEAIKRRKEGFGNKSEVKVEKTVAKIICDNLFSVFSVVLYGIGILFAAFSLYLHSIGESELARTYFGISKYGFLGPLTISIVMGIVTEIRSKRVLDKLRLENQPTAEVLRDGTWKTIPSTDLVLGDVISLSPGFQCAGDITVIEGECEVDESFMTGEAEAVVKSPEESRNRIYSGSAVLSGRVKGIVREVGKNTYINQLSKKVKKIQKSKSGLMRSIYMILDFNAILLFIIVGTVLGTLIYKVTKWGSDPAVFGSVMTLDSFEAWAKIITTTSAFAIGVIPTGLVLMTSVALAASVVTLAKQETLIQELYSLENLSRVDTLCLDKTGTLTDGSMKLETAVYLEEEEKAKSALRYLLGSLSDFNPTSQALLEAFGKEEAVEYASLIPFSSARKYSGVVTKEGKEIVMGAPEILFSDHPEALTQAKALASQGYRVIGLSLDKQPVSLFALKDGIRRSAKETIAFFVENHLDIKIISGDNPETVSSIAALCGVPNAEKAISLAGLSEDEVRKAASEYTVFARVSPEQKEILVSALQAKKHNVGMTGDGVNDILALRKANASITFHKATDAAKACADVVLLDDDFVHLKEVVGQGRKVVNNIERTAALFLMKTITIALLAFLLIPFKKGQMYYTIECYYLMQTAIIAVGGFFLSLEPRKQPIRGTFAQNVYAKALFAGLLMTLASVIPPILSWLGLMAHENATPMISLLEFLAGLIVIVVFCFPLNKYRVWTIIAVVLTAGILSLAFPRAYVGGLPLSIHDFTTNKVWHEFFQLWNSETFVGDPVKGTIGLLNDPATYITLGLFLLIGGPGFYFTNRFLGKKLEAKLAKKAKKE